MRSVFSRHPGSTRLDRHRHQKGYVAVVVRGGYVEAGDGGRVRVSAGDIVSHLPWCAHRDEFPRGGSTVLNLPLPPGMSEQVGRVHALDAVARLAERDAPAAAALACDHLIAMDLRLRDWPDLLATDITEDPDLSLAAWADRRGIAATSLSRGFAPAYGVSPKRFRLEQRTRRALQELSGWRGTLAALAAETGFADQAHLARSVRSLTGGTLRSLR